MPPPRKAGRPTTIEAEARRIAAGLGSEVAKLPPPIQTPVLSRLIALSTAELARRYGADREATRQAVLDSMRREPLPGVRSDGSHDEDHVHHNGDTP